MGLLGLFHSAYSILKQNVDTNKNFLILGDSVDFELDVLDKVNDFIRNLNNDFDLIRVVWTYNKHKNKYLDIINKSDKLIKTWNMFNKLTIRNYSNGFYKIKSPFFRSKYNNKKYKTIRPHYFLGGSHFTVVNGKNINKIINYMENENVYELDGIYSTNQLNVYCLDLPVHINVKFDSTIENNGYVLRHKKKK